MICCLCRGKNTWRWEGEVVSGGRAEWSSSGFNVNMNFTHGTRLCIYLHVQREKRCVQETGTDVRKLRTAPLIPRHFTDEGLERQCDFTLRCWCISSTDNNPLSKAKFGCKQNWFIQWNFFFCLIIAVGVGMKPCLLGAYLPLLPMLTVVVSL